MIFLPLIFLSAFCSLVAAFAAPSRVRTVHFTFSAAFRSKGRPWDVDSGEIRHVGEALGRLADLGRRFDELAEEIPVAGHQRSTRPFLDRAGGQHPVDSSIRGVHG